MRYDPVGTIDIAPTALTAAGIDLPDQLEGAPLQATGDREHTLTENDFDIVLKLRLRTLTTRDWKITRYEDTPAVGELYALSEDPEETREPVGRSRLRTDPRRPARRARRDDEPRRALGAQGRHRRLTA